MVQQTRYLDKHTAYEWIKNKAKLLEKALICKNEQHLNDKL